MTHPSSLALEAFACGEPSEAVEAHVATCDACRDFVGRLRDFAGDDQTAATLRAILDRSAASAPSSSGASTIPSSSGAPIILRRFWIGASTAMLPLVAAAAFVVFFRRADVRPEVHEPHDAPSQIAVVDPSPQTGDLPSETRFKGDVQLAVVRERAGHQMRSASTTLVRAGDRLRIEVALDREQVIVGGVFGDDGSYLELMPATVRGPGTHFSEHSVRIDARPVRGTIAVGTPEAMARARATSDLRGLTTLRLDVEGSP